MMMHRAMLAAAAFAGLAATCAAPARAVQQTPFAVQNGAVVVQASVDGRAPAPMRVDTGAGVTLLGPELGSLVFGPFVNYTLWRADGQRADLALGSVVSIAVGDYRIGDVRAAAWNGLAGSGVQGAISAMAFATVAVTFDFKNGALVVEDAPSFADRRRDAVRVPLSLLDDRGIALQPFARFDIGGKTLLCRIDTGSGPVVVDKRLGISGTTTVTLHDAPRVTSSGVPVTAADMIYDCDVGTSFWSGRALTLDILNRAAYVGGSL